jgi:hypothetical protein
VVTGQWAFVSVRAVEDDQGAQMSVLADNAGWSSARQVGRGRFWAQAHSLFFFILFLFIFHFPFHFKFNLQSNFKFKLGGKVVPKLLFNLNIPK